MAEPEDMIVPLLQEMRAEMREGFRAVDKRFEAVDRRLKKMDLSLDTFRQALIADTWFGKVAAGEIEERLTALESRLAALEHAK